jgi:hypothetical protein
MLTMSRATRTRDILTSSNHLHRQNFNAQRYNRFQWLERLGSLQCARLFPIVP